MRPFSGCQALRHPGGELYLGFGPRLLSRHRGGTAYILRLLPLGGSVQMCEASFHGKPLRQRLLVLVAGPLGNFLLALLLFLVVFTLLGLPAGEAAGMTRLGFFAALRLGLQQSLLFTQELLHTLGGMLSGRTELALSGPVGLAAQVGQASAAGWRTLLLFSAYLSLNLGIINLLPLPALDGGRIVFLLLEGLRGRPLNREKEVFLHFLGLLLLFGLLVLVTYQDILRLLQHSIG